MRIILLIFITTGILFAKDPLVDIAAQQQRTLDSIKLEVEALKRVRMEKANQLERAETERWQKRYIQNQESTEYQNETRILEGLYSKASDNMSRAATELGALRNLALEQKEKATAAKNALDNFNLQIKQAIDKNLEEIPQDFPAKMEERLLNFANNPPDIKAYFQDRQSRLKLTESQELSIKDSYRLRLGTVFFADAALGQSGEVKALMRTGTLSGKVFEWRSALSKELAADISQSVLSAQQKADSAWVPIDILQTKAVIGASTNSVEQTYAQKFLSWFKAGGLVMYPLALVALAALLIALERMFVLWSIGHISKTFTRKLHSLIQSNHIEEAKALCKKQKTSLGKILAAIVENASNSKSEAQKSVQRIILTEQAKLEKRMGFLAALGTVAPLLGLLGTVTGMILLFQVITQVGTNDARILAGGISEALITTETGLIIAIPIMLFHGKLSETLDYITTEIRIQSLAVLNSLWKD